MPNLAEQPSFRAEKDLVAALHGAGLGVLSPRSDSGSCRVLQEITVQTDRARIPDLLVVYQPDGEAKAIGILSYLEAAVLADVMANEGCTLTEIADRLYCNLAGVARCVESLRKRRLVDGYTSITANNEAFPNGLRIIAIEAKLTRWKEALRQAAEYFSFAHQSYIAMPSDVARRTCVVENCAASGVGILAVEVDGEVSVVMQSVDRLPNGPAFLRLVSKTASYFNA